MTYTARALSALVFGISIVTAACGGGTAQPASAGTGAATAVPQGSTPPAAVGGGSTGGGSTGGAGARGFDCATLLTPAELDQISGFTGGTVKTTTRGDQNAGNPGYGECAYEEPKASTFFGSIAIASGPAIEGYTAGHDYTAAHGGAPISIKGASDALLVQTDAGLNVFAKSADGVGINVGLAFEPTETTLDKAKAAIEKIAETVLAGV